MVHMYLVDTCMVHMYLVNNDYVAALIVSMFSGHYFRNLSTLDTGVFGYIT
jgi:hypothetical protein